MTTQRWNSSSSTGGSARVAASRKLCIAVLRSARSIAIDSDPAQRRRASRRRAGCRWRGGGGSSAASPPRRTEAPAPRSFRTPRAWRLGPGCRPGREAPPRGAPSRGDARSAGRTAGSFVGRPDPFRHGDVQRDLVAPRRVGEQLDSVAAPMYPRSSIVRHRLAVIRRGRLELPIMRLRIATARSALSSGGDGVPAWPSPSR